jgi:hypothetical protein
MKQTLTIPETFLGVGYVKDRAGLPLEAVRVPVPRPGADQVLIRVVAWWLNPLEYKVADLNFFGRTPIRSDVARVLAQGNFCNKVPRIKIPSKMASFRRRAKVRTFADLRAGKLDAARVF